MNHSFVSLLLAALLLPGLACAGPVDINTADAKTLARELKGIGLTRAQAIVDYRAKNGPFKTADELSRVKGIGQQVVEQNRANIRVEKSDKSPSVAASEKAKKD